jgi:IS30 family transposase
MPTKKQAQMKLQRRTEIIELRKRGLTNRVIATKLGTTERVISTLLYRAKQEGMTVPPPPYWSRGSAQKGKSA